MFLNDGDPIRNVPRSLTNEGQQWFRKTASDGFTGFLSVAVRRSRQQLISSSFSGLSHPIPFDDDSDGSVHRH